MRNNDFTFGLDDIVQAEDNQRTLARGVSAGLVVVFATLSGMTTFLFFERYATAVGSWAGAAAGIVAGIVGVICLDFGALAWSFIRSRAATSGSQMTIAMVAATVDIVLALSVSALFILLSTSLDAGIYDASGALTSFGQLVSYAGVLTVMLALITNFGCVFLWANAGADTRKAAQDTQLRAIVAAGRYRIDNARTQAVVGRTLEGIMAELPHASDAVAARQRQAYLDATMRPIEMDVAAHAPSANGANPTKR